MTFKAEYIWIDGTEPTAKLRSKAKIMAGSPVGVEEPPHLGLRRVEHQPGRRPRVRPRPQARLRLPRTRSAAATHILVMCEVFVIDGSRTRPTPAPLLRQVAERYAAHDTWFGLEQEYTFFDGISPLGWPVNGFPAAQGGYYCGVGADEVFGRAIVESTSTTA